MPNFLPQSPDFERRHALEYRAAARVQYREHNPIRFTTQLFVVLQAVTCDCPGFVVAQSGPVLHPGILQLESEANETRATKVIHGPCGKHGQPKNTRGNGGIPLSDMLPQLRVPAQVVMTTGSAASSHKALGRSLDADNHTN